MEGSGHEPAMDVAVHTVATLQEIARVLKKIIRRYIQCTEWYWLISTSVMFFVAEYASEHGL